MPSVCHRPKPRMRMALEQDQQRADLMEDGGGNRTQHPQTGQHDRDGIQPEGKQEDVLPDHADRVPGQADRLGKGRERVAHQDDRAGLGGQVAAHAGQRKADVGAGQGRGIVDAVADHRHDPPFAPAAVDPVRLAGRRQLGLDPLDVDLPGDGHRGGLAVARQDRQVLEAQVLQVVDRVVRVGAHAIPGADDADDRLVPHHDQGSLPRSVQALERRLDLGREGNPLLAHQARIAHDDAAGRFVRPRGPHRREDPGSRAGPGMRRSSGIRGPTTGPRPRASAPGDARWAARPRRPAAIPRRPCFPHPS